MKMFYVEVFSPAYPMKGEHTRVFTELHVDTLSPGMSAVWEIRASSAGHAIGIYRHVKAGKCVEVEALERMRRIY